MSVVTGANGFLGSHVLDLLRSEGVRAVGAGRPEVEIPSDRFSELLRDERPELIVHCAGTASVPASVASPLADLEGSVVVLAHLLEDLREIEPPPRLLFLSSAAVYGQPAELPVSELAEVDPLSPYGYHRAACELLLREANRLDGIPTAILRVFSAYGEGLRRQILWDVCTRLHESGRVELSGSGEESRDFIHAGDVARAAHLVAGKGRFEAEVYNVGSGSETTIRSLAEMLAGELGAGAEAVEFSGAAREGDPANWRADVGRIGALGFQPLVPIGEGVAAYARWAAGELGRSPIARSGSAG